ncbi:SRPBCC family protein [uncultured Aquimarina sp.]|uniref:SRPBCC family protein n=1 Tax=uncultured Aquimarina sp. TaxID=575652 RepID=UPI002608E13F|nr:SRPBCC family protein [uncultured Aquimarina sp.]
MKNTVKNGVILLLIVVHSTFARAEVIKEKEPNVIATAETIINAPIKDVWSILAEDWAGIGKWSSGVSHSQGFGQPIGGSDYTIRACEITAAGFDDTKEQILEYDDQNYLLKYELADGLPGFVKDAINIWTLEETANGTLIKGKTTMRATGIMGVMMKGIMKGATRKALESMTRELKHYVETGELHPDKLASNKKVAKKEAKMRKKVAFVDVQQEIDAPAERVWEIIGTNFANIADSNPDCPYSEWADGYHKAEVGAKRIMYMTDSRDKKYFVDEIAKYDPANYHITIEITNKKGFGTLNINYTWVNMDVEKISENKTLLKIRFHYLTKPKFLKGLAKGSMRKGFQKYAYGIDYHAETGELVTEKKWKAIKHLYK